MAVECSGKDGAWCVVVLGLFFSMCTLVISAVKIDERGPDTEELDIGLQIFSLVCGIVGFVLFTILFLGVVLRNRTLVAIWYNVFYVLIILYVLGMAYLTIKVHPFWFVVGCMYTEGCVILLNVVSNFMLELESPVGTESAESVA